MSEDFFFEEEVMGRAYDSKLMRRLIRHIKPYTKLFVLTLSLAFVITAIELALPMLTKIVIDQYLGVQMPFDAAFTGILTIAAVYLGLLLVRLVISYIQIFVLQLTGQRVMFDMRTEIFGRLMKLPTKFFDFNPVGRLVTRATNDVAAINEMFSSVLVYLVKDLMLITGIVVVMLIVNWKLALLIMTTFPIMIFITHEFRKRIREAYREVRRKLAKLNAYLAENISGMRITQLFVQEQRSHRNFSFINTEEYEAQLRHIKLFAFFQPTIHQMSALAIALIIWFGGTNVINSVYDIGMIYLFLTYESMLFQPIRDLAEKFNILQSAMASSERIFQLLDEDEERYEGQPLAEPQGRIEFRDVWFSYQDTPKRDQDWVLKGISFVAEPGERIAIVGPTGSGKTTIISLLLRLYEIQKGQILFDGVDIKELELDSLRSQMAVVLQDVFLFSGNIMDNIRLQDEEIPRDRAIDAARFVQAEEFINELPQQYETEVKERGSTLSVGQRQLLAFARAVAFDPKVLVLDEATANIDSKTEHLIQSSIEKILTGRTSIVIAHRLSTIRDANQILVLQKGHIVEQGTHDELFAKKGLYHALYTLQFGETGHSIREQIEHAPLEMGDD